MTSLGSEFDFEERQELTMTLDEFQKEATRIARNQRRKLRKQAAKYMKTRKDEVFSGTKLMPRMRRVMRFLNKNFDERIKAAAGESK